MGSDTAAKTIMLKGGTEKDNAVEGQVVAGPITPGMLIDYATSEKTLRIFNRAGNVTGIQPMFAVENDVVGVYPKTTQSIDTPYPDGDHCYGYIAERGDHVNALLDAGSAAVVFGDLLESAGAGQGTLIKRSAGTTLARALEAVNNSGGSNPARLRIEIL